MALNSSTAFEMESLKDKVVIVTGSSAGIGEATAVLFAKYGSNVVITGRNQENLCRVSQLCEEISPNKFKPLTVVGDIGEESTRQELINKTVEKYGKLDILVNNAGIGNSENIFSEKFPEAFNDIINTNLRAPLMLTRLALPHLIESKGCVINISSVASFRWILENQLPYNMSKSALDSMTRVLAHEFGPKGVRVVSVNPGWVKTTIHEKHNLPDTFYDLMAKDYPLRRAANSDEIASVICFLGSSGASFVTGTSVTVDGGGCTV